MRPLARPLCGPVLQGPKPRTAGGQTPLAALLTPAAARPAAARLEPSALTRGQAKDEHRLVRFIPVREMTESALRDTSFWASLLPRGVEEAVFTVTEPSLAPRSVPT